MPLSEHEQRVLEQMEQALYAEDPRLASQLKRPTTGTGPSTLDRRRIAVGILVAIAGLALVVLGVIFQQTWPGALWIGAIGFLAMVLGGAWAASPGRRGPVGVVRPDGTTGARPAGGRPAGGRPRQPRSGSFMERMEQQWDRRRENGL